MVYFRVVSDGERQEILSSRLCHMGKLPFPKPGTNRHPEDFLRDIETQTHSLPGELKLLASLPGSPAASQRLRHEDATAWGTAGGVGRRQTRAARPFCSHSPCSRGRKPRGVTNVGLERFSFPVTALAGVADVLISGLRVCLNYLYCA